MAGKHRGPTLKSRKSRVTRFALDAATERAFQRLVKAECRSIGNMATVLITEALQARMKRKPGPSTGIRALRAQS
jgi:hypothetical protein